MSDDPEKDEAALQARLAKLNDALRAQEERQAAERAPKGPSQASGFAKAMSAGLNVFSELAAAILVGGVIGWLADYWTGAKPWGLVVFLGLGAAAGFWNLYRLALRQAKEPSAEDER